MPYNNFTLSDIKASVVDMIVTNLFNSNNISTTEIDLTRQKLNAKINSSKILTTLDTQDDVLDSAKAKEVMENLYLDLLTAFKITDKLSSVMDSQFNLYQGFLNNAETQLSRLSDQLDSLEQTIIAKLNPVHYIEGFRSLHTFETDDKFYTDRYGETVNDEAKVQYNHTEQHIHLPVTTSINTLSGNDVINAVVNVEKQIGRNFIKIKNNINETNNIIDTSDKTFWKETILSNDILKEVSFGDNYDINYGALCELEIRLESVRKINEILVSPYCEYPISLIAIRYRETDNHNEPKKEFIDGYPIPQYSNFDTSDEYPLYIDKTKSFKFNDVVVKNIYILFTQVHYTKEHFILNKTDILKSDIWNNATLVSEKRVYDNQLLFNPILSEQDEIIPKEIQSKINSLNLDNINELDLTDLIKDNKNIYLEKYAYTYGFYNIAANFNDYSSFGIYVSSPVASMGNINQIKIQTEEFHPPVLTEPRHKLTDVEYYVSYKENPTWEDWLPILPENVDVVDCELLQLQNDICPLRFTASSVEAVYLFSKKLELNTDYTLKTNSDGICGIYIPNYNFNGIYTVKYTPIDKSKVITFDTISSPLQNTERLNGDGSNVYVLKNYPNLNYPTKITLTNMNTGEILKESDKQITCVTNILNPKESYKSFTKNTARHQYYIYKNVLYFNKNIDADTIIEIDYYHYISNVRMKAILRRNSNNRWLTPVVNKINYNFVTE